MCCFRQRRGVVVSILGRNHAFILGGHNHIILTTLLLPLMAGEFFVIGAFAFASLAISGGLYLLPDQSHVFYSHLFSLGTGTALVMFITYVQSLLRRRAFDSAFDVVCSSARLQNLSFSDALTGGYNRRHLEQVLEVELARSVRFARPLSVIMFDLDNLKQLTIPVDTRQATVFSAKCGRPLPALSATWILPRAMVATSSPLCCPKPTKTRH
jgi:hypothetical protein